MRLNPFAAARDWSKKRAYKKHLLGMLAGRPPGIGVEVPGGDDGEVWAAAVMDLLDEHPDLTVVKSRSCLTLCKRAQIEGRLSRELTDAMKASGSLPTLKDLKNGQ